MPLLLGAVAAVVLSSASFPLNLVLLAAGAALVVAVIHPPLALGVLAASVPVQSFGDRQIGPINLRLTGLMLTAIGATWLVHTLARRRRVRLDLIAGAFASYVAVLALTVVNAVSTAQWGTELYRWASALLLYVVAINTLETPRHGRPLLVGTAIAVGTTSVFGAVQAVVQVGPHDFTVGGVTRVYGTFNQPNPLAGYLELTVPLLVALSATWLLPPARLALRSTVGGPAIALSAGAAGLGVVALLLTQSRGGWLGGAAGLAVVLWLLGGRVRWAAAAAGVATLAAVVLTPYGAQVTDRFGAGFGLRSDGVQVTPQNFAVQERLAHWRAGWAMAKRYPLLGVGAGNFSTRYREFTPVWRFRLSQGHAHNAYVQVAAQSGVIGAIAYAGLVVAVGARLWRTLRSPRDPAARALIVGTVGVGVAFVVHNVFDYLHVLSLPVPLVLAWAWARTAATEPSTSQG